MLLPRPLQRISCLGWPHFRIAELPGAKDGEIWKEGNAGTHVGEAAISRSHLPSQASQTANLATDRDKPSVKCAFPGGDGGGKMFWAWSYPLCSSPESRACDGKHMLAHGTALVLELAPLEQLCFDLECFEESWSYRECSLALNQHPQNWLQD